MAKTEELLNFGLRAIAADLQQSGLGNKLNGFLIIEVSGSVRTTASCFGIDEEKLPESTPVVILMVR